LKEKAKKVMKARKYQLKRQNTVAKCLNDIKFYQNGNFDCLAESPPNMQINWMKRFCQAIKIAILVKFYII